MEYLLMMTLSGSTITAVCWILRRLLRNKISARFYYLLAKAAVLYYLVPLPFLKRWYTEALRIFVPERQIELVEKEIAHVPLSWTKYIVDVDGRTYTNTYMRFQTVAVLVWLSVACLLMADQIIKYVRSARRIAKYIDVKMTASQEAFLSDIKKQYGVRRRVLLYQGEPERSSMTFGIFRPIIFCGGEIGSRESELIVRHEMVHIRRLDAFWKILIQAAKLLHWYNPMMWLLLDEFDRVCEISCDEAAAEKMTEEDRNRYMRLLIEEAQEAKEEQGISLKWKAGFGPKMKRVKERMDNLMRKKKWNRFAAGTLVAALIFANSMTAFAYRDEVNEIVPVDMSEEEIEKTLDADIVLFTPEEAVGEALSEFDGPDGEEILYDRQFTDEEGNIYPVPDAEPHWNCDHAYVSGVETRHNKYSDGSCEVSKYNSQRCAKCGTIKMGDLISRTYYPVCPH